MNSIFAIIQQNAFNMAFSSLKAKSGSKDGAFECFLISSKIDTINTPQLI
jgi:hypothetical protein